MDVLIESGYSQFRGPPFIPMRAAQSRMKSKRRSGQTAVLRFHVILSGPETLFPIDFHEERDVCNSVDTFF